MTRTTDSSKNDDAAILKNELKPLSRSIYDTDVSCIEYDRTTISLLRWLRRKRVVKTSSMMKKNLDRMSVMFSLSVGKADGNYDDEMLAVYDDIKKCLDSFRIVLEKSDEILGMYRSESEDLYDMLDSIAATIDSIEK